MEKQTEIERQNNIDKCMNIAYENYHTGWIGLCRLNNIPISKEDGKDSCSIPANHASTLNDSLQRAEEMCIERYK